MSIYTSPSPSNISLNGNQTTWWIPATNYGSLSVQNVKVTVTVAPSNGLQLVSFSTDTGSYNSKTGIWSIGTLKPGIENRKWLRLVTSVVDIGLAPFTITSVISGDGVDPNNVNNTLVQTVTSIPSAPTAGAVDDLNMCHCGNVSCNDTPCNYGETTYVLDEDSVTNSTEYCWDEQTGEYKFIPDNPYYDVTFEYSIWCNGVEVSGPAKVQINKLFKEMSSFDHTLEVVCKNKIKQKDLVVLQDQHPNVSITSYCWRVLRNSLGVITSSEQVVDIDTRTSFYCSTNPCEVDCPTLDGLPSDVPSQFPIDYVPSKGDNLVIYHTDSVCVWTYNGTNWVKWSCGCQYKISKDTGNLLQLGSDNAPYLSVDDIPTGKEVSAIAFSGTTTKTLTLTFDDGTSLAANFVDISTGSADGSETKVTAGSNVTVSGTGTTADPYIINSTATGGTTADGSETKVQAGTNVTVTGTGTSASPYIINSTFSVDGSETKLSAGTRITLTGSGTTASPYVINANVDGSETRVTAGTGITVTGAGTTANPYVINKVQDTPTFAQLHTNSAILGANISNAYQNVNFSNGIVSDASLISYNDTTDLITIPASNPGTYEMSFSLSYAANVPDLIDFAIHVDSFTDEYMVARAYNESSTFNGTPTAYYTEASKSFYYKLVGGETISLKYKTATSTATSIDIRGAVLSVKKIS